MRRIYEYHDCPVCGRSVACWVPHRDDGSTVRMRKHLDKRDTSKYGTCAGSDRLIPSWRKDFLPSTD